MITTDPTKDLTAIGRLAGRLGVNVDALFEVAEKLEITPAMRVDRVVFFDREQAERIARHVKGERERLDVKVPATLDHRRTEHT